MNHLHPLENGVNIMKCNPDDYREDLACFELSQEQEDELILTLWEIARMFVEMSYGISPINNIFSSLVDKADPDSGNLLKQPYHHEFNQCTHKE